MYCISKDLVLGRSKYRTTVLIVTFYKTKEQDDVINDEFFGGYLYIWGIYINSHVFACIILLYMGV